MARRFVAVVHCQGDSAFRDDIDPNTLPHDCDAIAGERARQVGSGDRSERIRTYNFHEGRVTDHRIGLTLYKIESILNGDLDEIVDALITADTAEKLKAEEE